MKTILVAVSGMSPAIITETLWALALESPAVVPDEVVVITTSRGALDIQRDLLTRQVTWGGQSIWETLRRELLGKSGHASKSGKLQLSVRVIDLPDEQSGIRQMAADLRTRSDNTEAADFIIRTLSPYCDAEDNRVIASIAGGRKTMGALLYAAMSLLAKECDRVTHVLVSEPFESMKGFFYPDQPLQNLEAQLLGGEPVAVTASDARIEMADIPFVPLRNKFRELNEPRRTFSGLVDAYSRAERSSLGRPPRVTLDAAGGVLSVEGRPINLTGRDLVVAAFLHRRAIQGLPHFRDRGAAAQSLTPFLSEWKKEHPSHQATNRLSGDLSEDDLTKALASLRAKLRKAGLEGAVPHLVPERDRIGFEMAG